MTRNDNNSDDTTRKNVQNWLIINWKEGATRTRKSKPDQSKLGTHEIATRLDLDVVIPKVNVPDLAARIEVPAPVVQTAALEDVDADDLPDWQSTARDVLSERMDDGVPMDDLENNVDSLVVETLERAPGRPDVEDVRQDITTRLRSLRRESDA